MNIITARQALASNGGARIANCATLKHLFLPYGKQPTLIDYVTGLHRISSFTAHGNGWSAANVMTGSQITAGAWFAPGTNNFVVHCVAKFGEGGAFSNGAAFSNGGVLLASVGYIRSSPGTTRSIGSDIEIGVSNGYTLSRIGAALLETRKNGAVSATAALDPGDITAIDGVIGLAVATEFYGAGIFQFSGAVPANCHSVLQEWTANLLSGNPSLPIEMESWV